VKLFDFDHASLVGTMPEEEILNHVALEVMPPEDQQQVMPTWATDRFGLGVSIRRVMALVDPLESSSDDDRTIERQIIDSLVNEDPQMRMSSRQAAREFHSLGRRAARRGDVLPGSGESRSIFTSPNPREGPNL
jgi:hypothetical protein